MAEGRCALAAQLGDVEGVLQRGLHLAQLSAVLEGGAYELEELRGGGLPHPCLVRALLLHAEHLDALTLRGEGRGRGGAKCQLGLGRGRGCGRGRGYGRGLDELGWAACGEGPMVFTHQVGMG